MVDIVSAVGSVIKAGMRVKECIRSLNSNSTQCNLLDEEIDYINEFVIELQDKSKIPQERQEYYRQALLDLEKTLTLALTLIKEFRDSYLPEKIFWMGEHQDSFNDINSKLAMNMRKFTVKWQIRQDIDHTQTHQAREVDRQTWRVNKDDIVSEIQAAATSMHLELAILKARQHRKVTTSLLPPSPIRINDKTSIAVDLRMNPVQLSRDKTLLTTGEFGRLYLGNYFGQRVAVKRITHNFTTDASERFAQEVNIFQSLRHNHIVPIYAAHCESNSAYLVMKHMTRGSLHHVLATSEPSAKVRHHLAYGMALGLYYLHCHGIVHGDLSSHHVLVGDDYQAGLINFRLLLNQPDNITRLNKRANISPWMPPEVLAGTTSDPVKSDIYSFGVVLWELMTGKQPYAGYDEKALAHMICQGERERIPETVDLMYAQIIEQCWQSDPNARPALNDIIARLEKLNVLSSQSANFFDLFPNTSINRDATDADILYTAGCAYQKQKHMERAVHCHQRAAVVGHAGAKAELAMLLMRGLGIEEDKVAAKRWLSEAARAGNEKAMYNLARQLKLGDGVPRDTKMAYYWYKELADKGDEKALQKCRELKSQLPMADVAIQQPSDPQASAPSKARTSQASSSAYSPSSSEVTFPAMLTANDGIAPGSFSESELALAAAESKRESEMQPQIGISNITATPGFVTQNVGDDGNCFFYALADQLLKLGHSAASTWEQTGGNVEFGQWLRHLAGNPSGDWGNDDDMYTLARQLNIIIAVIDTRINRTGEHAILADGFRCLYIDGDGDAANTVLPNYPKDRPLIRLGHTGNHFISVHTNPELNTGAIRQRLEITDFAVRRSDGLQSPLSGSPANLSFVENIGEVTRGISSSSLPSNASTVTDVEHAVSPQ